MLSNVNQNYQPTFMSTFSCFLNIVITYQLYCKHLRIKHAIYCLQINHRFIVLFDVKSRLNYQQIVKSFRCSFNRTTILLRSIILLSGVTGG